MKLESTVNAEDQEDLYTEELEDWSNKYRMIKYEISYQKPNNFCCNLGIYSLETEKEKKKTHGWLWVKVIQPKKRQKQTDLGEVLLVKY